MEMLCTPSLHGQPIGLYVQSEWSGRSRGMARSAYHSKNASCVGPTYWATKVESQLVKQILRHHHIVDVVIQ